MGRDMVAKMPGYWDVRRCAWVLPEPGAAEPGPAPDATVAAAPSLPEPRADTDTSTATTA